MNYCNSQFSASCVSQKNNNNTMVNKRLSQLSGFFSEIFKFRKTSLTLVAIITYIVVFIIDGYAEYSALQVPVPEPFHLTSSWYDLQKISEKPHPFTSHANDEVFDYIYDRVNYYAARDPTLVEVASDKGNSSLFKQRDVFNDSSVDSRIIYFESGNILVKIKGSDPTLSGVLVSAHYDSVGTSYGTTDDGMGIASMLGVLDYVTTNTIQPKRDIVFNFNNDEEFGLLGATVFFHHPWSQSVEYFINLEGTGAGGRAILFRASDYGIAKYYKHVPSPFASSIFQEGFSNRVVGSETDYKVYLQNGLKGMDIAFYKPRSLYHTYRDSISTTSKGSLYHMLSSTLGVLEALANEEIIENDESAAVYFDIFGKWFVILSINTLYTLNIILLAIIPVIIIVLMIVVLGRGTWRITDSKLSAILRLPISMEISCMFTFWISDLIQRKNPLILSLNYNIVLIIMTSTFVLINYIILNFFNNVWKIHDQKLMVLLELTLFFWWWTIVATVRAAPPSVNTGEWIFTLLYVLFGINSIFGLLSLSVKSRPESPVIVVYDPVEQYHEDEQAHEENVDYEEEDNVDEIDIEEEAEEATESSPLISRSEIPQHAAALSKKLKQKFIDSLNYDWSIQFFLLVPISVYFVYFNGHELLQATYQNSHDGTKSIDQVFLFLKYVAIGLGIPLLPFVHKLNYVIRFALLAIIIFGSIVATTIFPFSFNNPLKVSFYQNIDLDNGSLPVVNVAGSASYIKSYLQDLPSLKNTDDTPAITCVPSYRAGQEICSYVGADPNLINNATGKTQFEDMLSYTVIKNTNTDNTGNKSPYEPYEADFYINVKDNRHCVLGFNTTKYSSFKYGKSPLRLLTIYHDDEHKNVGVNASSSMANSEEVSFNALPTGYSKDKQGNEYFKWFKGIDQIQLHKYDWDQEYYHIGLQWIPRWFDDEEEDDDNQDGLNDNDNDDPSLSKLGVTVECYWGEYDTQVKVGDELVRVLPAFDELMQYSPEYIIYTKALPGLVKIKKYIEL
ncbi:Pff1 protein [Saccharomycopsis crataegensis]|uniref:Peptide hydrolase n=1 Tax=Saccharomycopsis crataegensis TaxID=43959 RepID=A0AAV5QEQ9_9ASCO|nr:Pff1 protein [Saccharomycopsis crataegensis]